VRACSIVSPRDTGTLLLCSEMYRTSKPSPVFRMEVPEGRVEMLSYIVASFDSRASCIQYRTPSSKALSSGLENSRCNIVSRNHSAVFSVSPHSFSSLNSDTSSLSLSQ
jgi:hypothetical protein